MKNIINYENLKDFTYSNDALISGKINGIVLNFTGLGCMDMIGEHSDEAKEYAKQGIVLLQPYYNPWSWMNMETVAFVDEILAVIIDKYSLDSNIKIVSSGGSMGGLCALIYTRYAKITPVACVTNCPVCDLPYHYTERGDLPRTLYSAFSNYNGTFDEALRSASPMHQVDNMPDINYYIFHCEEDEAVNIKKHSENFVKAMKENHSVIYHTVPGKGHCDLSVDMRNLYNKYILNSIIS